MNAQQLEIEIESLANEYEQIMPGEEIAGNEYVVDEYEKALSKGIARLGHKVAIARDAVRRRTGKSIPIDIGSQHSSTSSAGSVGSTLTLPYDLALVWDEFPVFRTIVDFNTARDDLAVLLEQRDEIQNLYDVYSKLNDRSAAKEVSLYEIVGRNMNVLRQLPSSKRWQNAKAKADENLIRAKWLIRSINQIAPTMARDLIAYKRELIELFGAIPVPVTDLSKEMRDAMEQLRHTPIPLVGDRSIPTFSWIGRVGHEMRQIFGAD